MELVSCAYCFKPDLAPGAQCPRCGTSVPVTEVARPGLGITTTLNHRELNAGREEFDLDASRPSWRVDN